MTTTSWRRGVDLAKDPVAEFTLPTTASSRQNAYMSLKVVRQHCLQRLTTLRLSVIKRARFAVPSFQFLASSGSNVLQGLSCHVCMRVHLSHMHACHMLCCAKILSMRGYARLTSRPVRKIPCETHKQGRCHAMMITHFRAPTRYGRTIRWTSPFAARLRWVALLLSELLSCFVSAC